MSPNVRSPRPKPPFKQVLIRLALVVIAIYIAIDIPHSLIPMFKEPISEASPPPEIQNVLAGKRKIVTIGDSITEAGQYPGGYATSYFFILSFGTVDRPNSQLLMI